MLAEPRHGCRVLAFARAFSLEAVTEAAGGDAWRLRPDDPIATLPDAKELAMDHVNSLGIKGIGEIGVTGIVAAIANAVYHATGKRIRDLLL